MRLHRNLTFADKVEITFDYALLDKIIDNLLTNALKYSGSNSNIYVYVEIDEAFLNVTIKDEGIGITKEEQKLIFSRFYKSKNHLIFGGFGIGLSLVK